MFRHQLVVTVDVFSMGGNFRGCEFADLTSHLLMHFVQGILVGPEAVGHVEADFPIEGFTGGAPEKATHVGGEDIFHGFVAESELIDDLEDSVSESRDQVTHGADGCQFKGSITSSLGPDFMDGLCQFASRNGFRGRVGEAFGDDLMVVDELASSGEFLPGGEGALEESLRGFQKVCGFVETGVRGH